MTEIPSKKDVKGVWVTRTWKVNSPVICWLLQQWSCQMVRELNWRFQSEPHREVTTFPTTAPTGLNSPSNMQIMAFSCCIKITLISMHNYFILHAWSIFPKFPICFPFCLSLTWLNINPFPLNIHRLSKFSWSFWL